MICHMYILTVPDLPLCLGVLKHRVPAKMCFAMDFCLCGAILNLKAFCFGAIPDIIIELTACVRPPSGTK